jgi:hypothetical protein
VLTAAGTLQQCSTPNVGRNAYCTNSVGAQSLDNESPSSWGPLREISFARTSCGIHIATCVRARRLCREKVNEESKKGRGVRSRTCVGTDISNEI